MTTRNRSVKVRAPKEANEKKLMHDVIIVGGGAAGLSAALALGRCRRKVLLCDKGEPRNAASNALHGFITRDGIHPLEFVRLAREELRRYPSVELRSCEIVATEQKDQHFTVQAAGGATHDGRILLLATGLIDELPQIPGLKQFYGKSVHVCPYCDGWEHQDKALAVIGESEAAVELAIELRVWSSDIVFCANNDNQLSGKQRELLRGAGVRLDKRVIDRLEGEGESLKKIVFRDGSEIRCSALFVAAPQRQRADLATSLGCKMGNSQVLCSETQCTNIQGVFVIGNASRGLQLVIIAAAEGTRAAMAINEMLVEADFKNVERPRSAKRISPRPPGRLVEWWNKG